jgi:hypothetical protein
METDKELIYHQHYFGALLEYDPAVFGSWSKFLKKDRSLLHRRTPKMELK